MNFPVSRLLLVIWRQNMSRFRCLQAWQWFPSLRLATVLSLAVGFPIHLQNCNQWSWSTDEGSFDFTCRFVLDDSSWGLLEPTNQVRSAETLVKLSRTFVSINGCPGSAFDDIAKMTKRTALKSSKFSLPCDQVKRPSDGGMLSLDWSYFCSNFDHPFLTWVIVTTIDNQLEGSVCIFCIFINLQYHLKVRLAGEQYRILQCWSQSQCFRLVGFQGQGLNVSQDSFVSVR